MGRCEELNQELNVEREKRCASSAEVHTHLSREVVDIRVMLEQAMDQERESRGREQTELRGILDALWQHIEGSTNTLLNSEGLEYVDANAPTETPSVQDINTLYEMVREALADTLRLSQELSEEREARKHDATSSRRKLEWFERQILILRASMHRAVNAPRDVPAGMDVFSDLHRTAPLL